MRVKCCGLDVVHHMSIVCEVCQLLWKATGLAPLLSMLLIATCRIDEIIWSTHRL
eukprot:jgi/Botrbrau1/6975/Bobra.0165s0011.1